MFIVMEIIVSWLVNILFNVYPFHCVQCYISNYTSFHMCTMLHKQLKQLKLIIKLLFIRSCTEFKDVKWK